MIANAECMDSLTTASFVDSILVRKLASELEENGAVRLPTLLPANTLRNMQDQFARRLQHMRWNNCDGYERSERYRLMVQDALTLDQGFVDLALHPLVKAVLDEYLGTRYELCEAKGLAITANAQRLPWLAWRYGRPNQGRRADSTRVKLSSTSAT